MCSGKVVHTRGEKGDRSLLREAPDGSFIPVCRAGTGRQETPVLLFARLALMCKQANETSRDSQRIKLRFRRRQRQRLSSVEEVCESPARLGRQATGYYQPQIEPRALVDPYPQWLG